MPRIFYAFNHPLITPQAREIFKRAVILQMDTSKEGMEKLGKAEKKMRPPTGGREAWVAQGLVEILPGDMIFFRDMKSTNPEHDVLGGLSTDGLHHGEAVLEEFDRVCRRVLGVDGLGPGLEGMPQATKVQKGRCYTVGNSTETCRLVVAPAASGSGDGKSPDNDYQMMVKRVADIIGRMGENLFSLLPKKTQDAYRANHEVTNHPVLGNFNSMGGTHIQLNISQPTKQGDTAHPSSRSSTHTANGESSRSMTQPAIPQIVRFGGYHQDKKDHPAYLTILRANHHLPDAIHPGYFHIRILGIFTALYNHRELGFSGQFWHTATEVELPDDYTDDITDAFRLVGVQYPNLLAMSGRCRLPLGSRRPPLDEEQQTKKAKLETSKRKKAARRNKEKGQKDGPAEDSAAKGSNPEYEQMKGDDGVMYVTPEMVDVQNAGHVLHGTKRSTYIKDGQRIMDRHAHMNFVGRALIQQTAYLLRQMPEDYEIDIDVAAITKAVTYAKTDGSRTSLEPWDAAPNVRTVSSRRAESQKTFQDYENDVRRFIPTCANRDNGVVIPANDEPSPSRSKKRKEKSDDQDPTEDTSAPLPPASKRRIGIDRDSSHSSSDSDYVPNSTGGKRGGRESTVQFERRDSGESEMDIDDTNSEDGTSGGRRAKPMGNKRQQGDNGTSTSVGRTRSKNHAKAGGEGVIRPNAEAMPRSNNTSKFEFLQMLTTEAIDDERGSLERVLASTSTSNEFAMEQLDNDIKGAMAKLTNATAVLEASPLSIYAPSLALHLAELAQPTEAMLRHRSVLTKILQQRLIKATVRPWNWVDYDVSKLVNDRFLKLHSKATDGSLPLSAVCCLSDDDDWLWVIIKLVVNMLVTKASHLDFHAETHPSMKDLPSSSYSYKNPFRRRLFTIKTKRTDFAAIVVKIVREVLPGKLGFLELAGKRSNSDRARAWFIKAVEEYLGEEILMSDMVWRVFTDFKNRRYVITDCQYRTNALEPHHINPFIEALSEHAVMMEGSPEAASYSAYKDVVRKVMVRCLV